MENNQRIIFDLPEYTTLLDVIDEILKNNGVEESDEEFFDKDIRGEEPRGIIIRDAALTIAEKKLPEDKLIDFLQKHLKTSKETAEKIVSDIKQKIMPFAKKVSDGLPVDAGRPQMGNAASDVLSIKKEPLPYDKKIEFKNVEKNAEELKKARTVLPQEQEHKGSDEYREPIE